MASVHATGRVTLQPDEAAALWRDPRRWSAFVEGFQRVEELGRGGPNRAPSWCGTRGPGAAGG